MKKLKLRPLISIDEWDIYTQLWNISPVEVQEESNGKKWILTTTSESIANELINQKIAKILK